MLLFNHRVVQDLREVLCITTCAKSFEEICPWCESIHWWHLMVPSRPRRWPSSIPGNRTLPHVKKDTGWYARCRIAFNTWSVPCSTGNDMACHHWQTTSQRDRNSSPNTSIYGSNHQRSRSRELAVRKMGELRTIAALRDLFLFWLNIITVLW